MENNKHDAIIKKESEALMMRPESMQTIVVPATDVFETADAFVVKLDVPGTTSESIYLSISPNQLSVKAEIESFCKGDAKILSSEIGRKIYLREFNIGQGIDHDRIDAKYEDGVLTITLPKTDEVKAKEIPIH